MSNNPRFRRIGGASTTLLALSLTVACATSKRPEPAGSAASETATSQNQQHDFATPPPPSEQRDEESAKAAGPIPAPSPQAAQATHQVESRAMKRSAGAPAAAARSPSMDVAPSAPAKPKAEEKGAGSSESDLLAGKDDSRAEPLRPSPSDSPDLRVALQDWQNAADQLTSSRGCDDGCRAFQSMQRAAARICNLVFNQDPSQRCATAKSRVRDAERDITRRCGKCDR